MKKIEYKNANGFMFAAASHYVMPAIHWRDGDDDSGKNFIWFQLNENYIVKKGELHVFYSDNKKLLDAIWNSVGLIKCAVKLVHEV